MSTSGPALRFLPRLAMGLSSSAPWYVAAPALHGRPEELRVPRSDAPACSCKRARVGREVASKCCQTCTAPSRCTFCERLCLKRRDVVDHLEDLVHDVRHWHVDTLRGAALCDPRGPCSTNRLCDCCCCGCAGHATCSGPRRPSCIRRLFIRRLCEIGLCHGIALRNLRRALVVQFTLDQVGPASPEDFASSDSFAARYFANPGG